MTCDDWNSLLCDHFVQSAVPHSTVYLTVDKELVRALGAAHGVHGEGAAERDLATAVRSEVRRGRQPGDDMTLSGLRGQDTAGRPRGVAFLALCVLAAHSMGDNDYSENAYFGHLCGLLEFPGNSRPSGMHIGSEEPLWQEWGRYLARHHLLSSARPGPIGPTRYINYPISQTLLRFTDRERLQKLFGEQDFFHAQRDPDILIARIYALRDSLTGRFQEKLRWTGERFAGLTLAVYELHQSFLRSGGSAQGRGIPPENALSAEIARVPGGFRREPVYQLFLRTRPGFSFGDATHGPEIEIDGAWHRIEPGEEGGATTAFLGKLTPEQVVQGGAFPIRGGGFYTQAILTKRPFRILMSHPDAIDQGIYESGRAAAVGVHFIFLCKDEYLPDLERLKTLGKIAWSRKSTFGTARWTQLDGVMILDEDWTHVRVGDPDLFNALRPKSKRTIGIAGGLKTPHGYLSGVTPRITVFGAGESIPVRIMAIHDQYETPVWDGSGKHGQPVAVPEHVLDRSGIYRIEAGEGDALTQRLLRIADWDAVTCSTETFGTLPCSADPLARITWV
jgi:hypothetical protein